MTRVLFCWIAAAVVWCADAAEGRKVKVLTTFLPGYSFAANVAGDFAEVENLLPGGVSLHDFQLTPTEMRKISGADVIVVNGLGMETFLDRAMANAAPGTKEKIVTLSAGLSKELIEEAHHHHHHDEPGHDHGHDPHIWLDPQLAMHSVSNVLAGLTKTDPANAKNYAASAAQYIAKLKALDEQLSTTLSSITNTSFITYHNAFRYFARRYGLKIAGVVEQVPEVSPSPRDLSALHKTIRTQKVKALFTEPGGGTRLAAQIAKDAKINLGELDPLETGELTARSYEEGMRRNAEALRKTLSQ